MNYGGVHQLSLSEEAAFKCAVPILTDCQSQSVFVGGWSELSFVSEDTHGRLNLPRRLFKLRLLIWTCSFACGERTLGGFSRLR